MTGGSSLTTNSQIRGPVAQLRRLPMLPLRAPEAFLSSMRTRWTVDSLLFAAAVVSAMSVSSQATLGLHTLKVVILDVIGGFLFVTLPLLLLAAIRINWMYRNRHPDTGHVRRASYVAKTATMSTVGVAALHMFAPSSTLLLAVGVAILLSVVLTVLSPITGRPPREFSWSDKSVG